MPLFEPSAQVVPAFLKVKPPERISCAVFGETKSGKTYFAGTFPTPLVIAAQADRGYSTLQVDHPNAENISVWPIPEVDVEGIPTGKGYIQSLTDAVAYLEQNYQQFESVVLDVTTMLADGVYDELTNYGENRMKFGKKGGVEELDEDREQRIWTWDNYTGYWRDIRDRLVKLPLHICWTFHCEEAMQGPIPMGLKASMKGRKALDTILGSCEFQLFLDRVETTEETDQGPQPGKTLHRLWTRSGSALGDPQFIGGVRFQARFPEPCIGAHFNSISRRLFGEGGPTTPLEIAAKPAGPVLG